MHLQQGVSIRPFMRWFLWHCVPICGFLHSVSIQWMQLSNVPAAVHSPMGDTTGTIPLHCLLPRKYFVSDRRTSVMMLNLDGYGEACGNCVPLGAYVCSPCHIIFLCPFLFLVDSCVLISLFLALYLSVVLSLSFSLPQSRTFLGAVAALSLFLSHCFHSPISFSRSLSHSLTGPLTLFSPPIPPPFYLFLSLPHDCDGSQHPAQMCVISDSI